jgi:hypothetical protein
VHAWDVHDRADFELSAALGLPVVCTDRLEQALQWREAMNTRSRV